MERVKQLAAHLTGSTGGVALDRKSPDDVVITMAIRSPLCKAKKGGFRDARYVAYGLSTHWQCLIDTSPFLEQTS